MDKNKKSKTFNKMSIRKGISLSLAALTLAGPIVPYAVYANPTAAVQDTLNAPAKVPAAYPTNITDKINWDNKGVTDADKDYWSLNQQIGVEPTQKIVRVTTSDPIENTDINYQGYFVDANGRTNLRFVYMEKSAAISAVWHKILLRFDDDLYGKIDFDKSYGIGSDETTQPLLNSNGKNEKALEIIKMVGTRTQNRTNVPINIVLKEGLTFANLGSKNLKIQMRLVDDNLKRIYAFAPKGSSIDYSTYTKQTVIPIESNIDGLFLRGPREDDGKKFAFQRAFMAEFIANPENYNDSSELGILRTEYQAERDSSNPKDIKDGKPAGFIQAFDAKLVPYLKADVAGNIAYTNLLDVNRKEVKNVQKQGIKLEDINYSDDKKVAYIVFGQANFKKGGVNVVSLDKFDGKINQSGFYYTAIDYVVDKKKFQDTFETTGTTKVDFDIMTGWAETNPTGWTIYEKDYDNDFVVQEEDSFMFDLTQDPTRKQIMIQAGDPEEAFIRTMQGYYSGHKDGKKGIEQIQNIGVGLYELTLREGATIKAGEKFRILIPDAADHQGPVNFLETHNGSKKNKGAATLKLNKDRKIDLHIFSEGQGPGKPDGTFRMIYTPKGETDTKTINFTKNKLKTFWQTDDKAKIVKNDNTTTGLTGGNFTIDTDKLEPGKDIYVEAISPAGEKIDNLTSWFKYIPLDKSAEKYERMAWIDHAEDLASVGIDKSTYVPYQEIFTNDYKTGTDEIYKDPRLVPADKEDFMAKTGKIEGFTQYDGGKIRMRYIAKGGATYVGKTEAAANEYDDKGEVKGTDYTQKVTINGKEYEAMPYELDLAQVSELKDADPATGTGLELKKDMRLIFNASNGSSLPSDWYDTRVKTRVLFDATEGQFEDTSKKAVKVVPDNVKYYQEEGYAANGFTGANVKAGTGDEFAKNPTADGKTFLGWVTEEGKTELGNTIVKAEAFNNLDATKKFTAETPVDSHKVVYAIWSEEQLITFDANGGKFADNSTTKTDDLTDGVQAPANPTQDGKTFVGWAKTANATEADVIDVTTLTDATTVYAVWKDGVQEKTAAPTVEAPKAGDKEIKGTAPAGSDVTVKLPDGTEIKAKADQDGKWTATLPADKELAENDEIKVVAKDGDKEPSEEVKATVGAKTPEEKTAAPTVEAPKAGDKEIKGTAPAGSDVTVKLPDGTEIKAKAGQDGKWTANVPADKELAENDEIKVVAKDGDKEPSEEVKATVGAKTPEEKTAAPTVEAPKAGDTTVSGTGKPGAKVNITKENAGGSGAGTEIARDVVVGDDGTWTANVPEGVTLAEGDIIYATQKEEGKTVSDQAEATVVAADTKVQAPDLKANDDGSVTVTPPTDKDVDVVQITYTDENNHEGTLAATKGAGGQWKLPDGTDPSITIDPATGVVTIPANQVADGSEVKAVAQKGTEVSDEAKVKAKNNPVAKKEVTKWVQETADGRIIVLKTEDGNKSDNDGVSDFEGYEFVRTDKTEDDTTITYTNVYKLLVGSKSVGLDGQELKAAALGYDKENPEEFTGYTFLFDEAGNTPSDVEGKKVYVVSRIYAKNPTVVEVADTNSLTPDEQKAVKAAVKAANPDLLDNQISVDNKGEVTIKRGNQTAKLASDLTVVKQGQTAAPTVEAPKAGDKEIKGTAPAGSDVTVKLPDGTEIKAKADQDGKWTATLPADKELAENDEIKVVAKDGDKAPSEEVKATVGAKTPEEKTAAPTVEAPKAGDKEIKGTAPAGSDVTVKLPDGTEVKAKADQDGKWTATLPADKELAENDEIKVVAKDGDKAPSEEVKATVGAKTPEENKSTKPTIKPVKVGDKKITGTASPNAIVNVTYPNGDVTETTADPNGNWSVDAPQIMTEGQTITATATEDGKEESDPEKATVKGNKPAVDDKTTIDDSKSKPVEPTNKDQGTGIIVNNPQGSTITAEDEDGRYVPVSIDPITGEIVVYPGSDVDGPIKVTITDRDGNVRVIYIDVIGHAMGRDDNQSDRDNYWFLPGLRRHDRVETHPVYTVVPEKTTVGTPVHDTLWYVFHINEYEYEVVRNGVVTKRIMDVTPVIQNDRTMLPLRYVAEAIGADVQWDAKTRTATFTKNGLTASIQIDSDEIVLSNGKTIKMDSKPLNIKDRILVSVTNVANVFGMTNGNTLDGSDQDIEWNQNDKTATIYIRR